MRNKKTERTQVAAQAPIHQGGAQRVERGTRGLRQTHCAIARTLVTFAGLFLATLLIPGIVQAQTVVCQWVKTPADAASNYAPTTADPWDFSYTFPATVSIPRDAPVGTVIASATLVAPVKNKAVRCTNGSNTGSNGTATKAFRTLETDTTLMQSGIPGVSFRRFRTDLTTASNWDRTLSFTGDNLYVQDGSGWRLELVKTDAVLSGGTINSGLLGQQIVTPGNIVLFTVRLANNVRIVPQTCRVTNANIVVKLTGDAGISPRSFASVGSTSAPVGFNIGVDCSGVASKVFMTLTDQQNPDNTSNTLALTRASSALGLGIQFLFNGTPVSLGPDSSAATNTNQFAVFTSTGAAEAGTTNVPLAARYIRTGTVKSGSANGVATFTMSYQ